MTRRSTAALLLGLAALAGAWLFGSRALAPVGLGLAMAALGARAWSTSGLSPRRRRAGRRPRATPGGGGRRAHCIQRSGRPTGAPRRRPGARAAGAARRARSAPARRRRSSGAPSRTAGPLRGHRGRGRTRGLPRARACRRSCRAGSAGPGLPTHSRTRRALFRHRPAGFRAAVSAVAREWFRLSFGPRVRAGRVAAEGALAYDRTPRAVDGQGAAGIAARGLGRAAPVRRCGHCRPAWRFELRRPGAGGRGVPADSRCARAPCRCSSSARSGWKRSA